MPDDDEAKEFLRSLLHQRDARVSELMFEQSRLRNVQEQNRAIEGVCLGGGGGSAAFDVDRLEAYVDRWKRVVVC